MKVKLQKATVTAINIKEAIKLTIELGDTSADDLVELCKLRNIPVSLTFSDSQTQLGETIEVGDEAAERLKEAGEKLQAEGEMYKVEEQHFETGGPDND